jgi:hypothetical protein
VTGPAVKVDPVALEVLARELATLSEQLSDGISHQTSPTVDQPSGAAVVGVDAAANHVVGECAANLLLFAQRIAESARWYRATDTDAARAVAQTMQPR